MGALAIALLIVGMMFMLFCYGLYDDMLKKAVIRYKVRKGWNPDEQPPRLLRVLVRIRLKTME
jgi:hypothetical protein